MRIAPPNSGSATRDYIAVARGSDLVVIRVIGKGNMLTAPGLSDFADQQRKAGFKRFVFDLERCTGLDSTFMGVMVAIHTGFRERSPSARLPAQPPADSIVPAPPELRDDAHAVSAVNVPPHIRDVMAMLGVDKFVKMRGSCDLKPLETTILPEKNIAPDERRRLIIKAHETLVEIDKRNQAQFGAFLESLAAEIEKE